MAATSIIYYIIYINYNKDGYLQTNGRRIDCWMNERTSKLATSKHGGTDDDSRPSHAWLSVSSVCVHRSAAGGT